MSGKKVLLVYIESYPKALPWPDDLGGKIIKEIIDWGCETFEDITTPFNTIGAYDQIIKRIGTNCIFQNLVDDLIGLTKQGNTIDLVILGHGGKDDDKGFQQGYLTFHDDEDVCNEDISSETKTTSIRYRAKQIEHLPTINLRMVYMCNCYGCRLNLDWVSIGAQVAIGPWRDDYMPEPMTSKFLQHWAMEGMSASDAASQAWQDAKIFFDLLPLGVGILYECNHWVADSTLIVTGPNKTVTRDYVYPTTMSTEHRIDASVPAKDTNPPPYLMDVIVAQPQTPQNPSGFGQFTGESANIRYRASWPENNYCSERSLSVLSNELLDPGQQSYIFLRFGPHNADGTSRPMNQPTITLQTSLDSANWSPTLPINSGSDANGPYYWVTALLPNNGTGPLTYALKIDGKDAIDHDAGRSPRGDELVSDPSFIAYVNTEDPAYPFVNYIPGPDCHHHQVTVEKTPQKDSYEPNDTAASPTVIDLTTTQEVAKTDLSLFPSNDVDYFKILLPALPDKPKPKIVTGGKASPTSQVNSTLTKTTSWDAFLTISIAFEDLGNGAPVPDVHVYDTHQVEITPGTSYLSNGEAYISITDPAAKFPDGSLFVKVANTPAKSLNYSAFFWYTPYGRASLWNPSLPGSNLPGFDMGQIFIKAHDYIVQQMITNPGGPVENIKDRLSYVANQLNEHAITAISNSRQNKAVAKFLIGLGLALAEDGCPEALKVFKQAQQAAKKSGDPHIVVDALHGQELVLKAAGDLIGLKLVIDQLAKFKVIPPK